MLLNDIKLAVRHLSRQKLNTALHVIGLTLGMSVCLLIGLFLRYELSFDNYHDNADRTYRVTAWWGDQTKKAHHFSTPIALAEGLRASVTGLENITMAHPNWSGLVEINSGKRFMQNNILIVNPEILDIFDIEIVSGNAHEVLRTPYQALLTETTAKKFFGRENPVGKTFLYRNDFHITVGGVIRDMPSNTHLAATMLLSFVADKNFIEVDADNYGIVRGNSTFVVLSEHSAIEKVEAQLKNIADGNINSKPGIPKGLRCDFKLQPLKDIHFQPQFGGGGAFVQAVNSSWLWFFATIGVLVLTLACINFINLSTAQALTRAKEVGVRKTVGAGKLQLITQFLTESCMLALIAGILSLSIGQASLPYVNTLLEKGITFNLLQSPIAVAAILLFVAITGLLAGLYPAWIIARLNPAANLRPGTKSIAGHGTSVLRRLLVVVQFTISIGLLISVVLIAQQVTYLRSKNMGYDRENVVTIPIGKVNRTPALAAELGQIPQVKEFSFATGSPSTGEHWGAMISLTDGNDPNRVLPAMILADEHFCNLYDLKLVAGRLPVASDTNHVSDAVPQARQIMKVMVNEKLVKELGFESNESAVGRNFWISMGSEDAEIIGVLADFNTSSLHSAVIPVIILQLPKTYKEAGIRIAANTDIPSTIAALEAAWKKVYPEEVFEAKFLDQQLNNFYRTETRLYILFKIFSGLAMIISCLGLWGLAAFAAQQRTKEIGIRKVLGASVKALATLLTKDFLLMVLIALLIAVPLSYYFINNWLQTFAYHIDIGWQVFVLSGAFSIGVAIAMVISQTLKVANANPVNSLRSE